MPSFVLLKQTQQQHRQNATWEPAIVVNQCAPNSYWIMQENGAVQPINVENKIYSN